MRRQMGEIMEQSAADEPAHPQGILSLAERMTNIEMRLDDMEAKWTRCWIC